MVAAPHTSAVSRAPARGLLAGVDAAAASLLAGLVLLSFAVRLVVGWLRATPNYFSDEYLYAELGRSLVESGRPLVRGADLGFPALLQPLLTAPAWLFDDVWVSYRLIQALGALAMSLAAVPAYLLARRVGVGRPLALGVAAFALAIPDLLFASWLIAEPFAYPLVIAAVLAGTTAVAEPSRRNSLLFVACAGLCMFARVQFAVLPLCFLVAVVAVGLRERRVRAAVRDQALALAVFGAAAALAAGVGVARVLGSYETALDGRADPIELAERIGLNALVLAYSSGWILLPGALLGLALTLVRPRTRAECAFGAFAAPLAVALLLQAGLIGAVDHAQERYVFYVLPLLAVSFCLYATRGWPARVYLALVAATLVAASAAVPLAGFAAADGKAHSPLLLAAFEVERWLGSAASGSLAFAVPGALLCALGVALSFRPRVGAPAALALAIATCAVVSAAAVSFDRQNSAAVRDAFLPAEPSWVDRHGLSDVVLLRGPDGTKTEALEQLFWNRSVTRVALLPGAEEVDHVTSPRVRFGADGTLLVNERPVRTPLLVDGFAGSIRLAEAELLDSSSTYKLWRPRGRARLSLYLAGRYSDGWLAGRGRLTLWPNRPGSRLDVTVRLTLTAPEAAGMTLRFEVARGPVTAVHLRPGERKTVSIPICSRGPSHVTFTSSVRGVLDGRIVSAHAGEPELVPSRCATQRRRRSAV